jgi:hypothetical protein
VMRAAAVHDAVIGWARAGPWTSRAAPAALGRRHASRSSSTRGWARARAGLGLARSTPPSS